MADYKQSMKNGISVALFFSFMVFVFAPIEFFFSGKRDFWFDIWEILPFASIGFVGSFVGITAFFAILGKIKLKWLNVVLTALFALTLACYIQGNFILVNYGQLDGRPIEWSDYRVEGIVSVGLWVGIFVIAFLIAAKLGYQKLGKLASIISICIVLVQLTTLTVVAISKDGFKNEIAYLATTEGEFDYSKNENLIVLLLDSFDSKVFTEILNEEDGEEYAQVLEDFTYYQNTLGAYSTTDLAIPQMLTGEQYLNEVPLGEYLEYAYSVSPLFDALERKGYSINICTDVAKPKSEISTRVENWLKADATVSSHKRLAGYMYRLAGFRYLPQPLKKYCWFYPDEMLEQREFKTGNAEVFKWSNYEFYDNISKIQANKEKGSFHFYHLEGTHWPYSMNRYMEYSEEQTSLKEEALAMRLLIDKYLSELKKKGVYDNSAIIIMADHGIEEEHQCPVLLVKGKNEKHEFSISKAPVSYFDLQEAYAQLLNGGQGAEVFRAQEGQKRERKFYYYSFGGDLTNRAYATAIREFKTKGDAFDRKALEETGEVFTRK